MPSFELPASFAQRRFWWLDRMDPGLATYNVPWSVELTGPLDESALRAALQAALDRHESLRTTLREVDGDAVQVVADHATLAWQSIDLSAAVDPFAAATARAEKLARQPFDLERGPLLRTELLRLGDQLHRLVLICHHTVGDGWSFDTLFGQLVDDYAGRPVAPPPIQYADFAAWQAQQESTWAPTEEYWRTELDGAPVTLELAGVRPRPHRPSYLGRTIEFRLPAHVADGVSQLARGTGTTLFTMLLAGFATLVSRMAAREDLLIGVAVSGRLVPETEKVVGLFTNTLPLRLRPRPDVDFRTLLEETHRTVMSALTHQELPFERIVELCQVPRDVTRAALVQVFFQFEEMPKPSTTGELTWTPLIMDNGGAKFDLTMATAHAADGGLMGWLNYATDIFDEAWADRFIAYYTTLLAALTADPTTPLSIVDYLPAAERNLVTGVWANGPAVSEGPTTATELLMSAVGVPSGAPGTADAISSAEAARGTADAISSAEAAGGWAAGDEVPRIAGALRALGVGPESKVGIHLSRDDRLIAAVLGVWWAGAAYVPLDPNFPPNRLAAMMADSGLTVILGDDPTPAVEGLGDVRVLPYKEALLAEPVSRVEVPADAAAYTIFTSGSTGRPKGVTVTQENVATMLRAFRDILPLGRADHLVAVTTLSFDISILELTLPLLCGARVTVADADTAADAMSLRRLLEDCGATALQATPATWRALHVTGGIPANIRLRLCGGEALPRDLAEALTADGAEVWNVYGPTETTVWSAAGRVSPGDPVRVGPPIPGTRIYVLDDQLAPVPIAVTGQVFIGGPGVSRGYHGRPGLTARQFVPDPFSSGGTRLYATGDLGRWTPDGRLELLGRNDHQVKIRGFRIEPGEVEAVLRTHPLVNDAVVVVRGDDETRHLAAYVTADTGPDGPLTDVALREFATRQLPAYLVPGTYAILDQLPLNTSGKVDRDALPDLVPDRPAGTAPTTATEIGLAALWRDVLGVDRVNNEDDFFALGGHSLGATRLLFRIRETFGREVTLRDFYSAPTLADCARLLDSVVDAPGLTASSGPTIGRIDRSQLTSPVVPR